MTAPDDRLSRVLALAERPGTPGERQAAEAAVGRIVCADLSYWRQRLLGNAPRPQPYGRPEPPRQRQHRTDEPPNGWRPIVKELLDRYKGQLTDWEYSFLDSISYRMKLSPRQCECLWRIIISTGIKVE